MNPPDNPFGDHAADYARYRPTYPSALFAFLARTAPATDHAWDCATGSGQAAVALAQHFDRVTATDASAGQLAHAQPHARVRYRPAPAEAGGLPDTSVDLITVAQALHWFDRPAFFAEAERVLHPGGLLAVWTYGRPHVGDGPLATTFDAFYDAIAPYWPPERALVESGYREIAFPFVPVSTPTFTLTVTWPLDALLGYVGTWSALKRHRRTHPDAAPLADLRARLAPLAPGPVSVRWPLSLFVRRR